jgi:hypothetical protein
VGAVFNTLVGSGVLTTPSSDSTGTCKLPPPVPKHSRGSLNWKYTLTGCPDDLVITINRGWTAAISQSGQSGLYAVGTVVTVKYPYQQWGFNSAIQLLIPGANYAAPILQESATVHNQM